MGHFKIGISSPLGSSSVPDIRDGGKQRYFIYRNDINSTLTISAEKLGKVLKLLAALKINSVAS